ncbi:DNA-processing protein DprA [Curtobacterium sp. YC1]|uniref:DNA-processing protein DprA n=1 Tax=Curtobacterium sp. YC1 TaxID=2795488 RepID=UPI0018E5791F|nr:DNA-processing protein DprA [Curtobacterium sp. YC1]QQD75109.1 DNA-processing protein DprA [Curtobacterium sp. YC1]
MTPVGTELLDAVVRLLGRSGGAVDPAQAAARVAWSAVVEPGDSVAGELLSGLGPERALGAVLLAADDGFDTLLGRCVEAEVAGAEDPAALLHGLKAAVERWTPRLSTINVGDVLAAAGAVGAGLLVPESDEWPSAMDDLGPHAPVVLWARSAAAQLGGGAPALGVVGSRANTVAGAEAAAEITSTAADAGCTIVSGGAYGIDAVAHRVTIAAGTPTVAVLAGGIDQLYPAGNAQLLHNVARQGALLAESAPGTRPTRWRFLAQNVKSMRPVRI